MTFPAPGVILFPMNVVEVIAQVAAGIQVSAEPNDAVRIIKRPLRPEDPNCSIGIFPVDWSPDMETKVLGRANREPQAQQYRYLVQGMIKKGREDEAIQKHSVLSYLIRQMLYRDPAIELALPQLKVSLLGSEEKAVKWDVLSQDYGNNDESGRFVYLSATEFYVETATTNL